jgi:hypothetical protein
LSTWAHHRWCLVSSLARKPLFAGDIAVLFGGILINSRAFVATHRDARAGDDSDYADSLGYRLHDVASLQSGHALGGALLRIFGGFAAAHLAVNLIGATGVNRQVLLLYGRRPSSRSRQTSFSPKKYRQDPGLAASIVVISTLISILTITIVFWLIL